MDYFPLGGAKLHNSAYRLSTFTSQVIVMPQTPHLFGQALDTDPLDDLDLSEADLDSANESKSPVLLNGMKVLFDKAVPVSPVSLILKAKSSRHGSHV